MIFRQLFDVTSSTYTYLCASGSGREAVIIDPVLEHAEHYIKLLDELDIKLSFVIDTHTHADHVTASGTLRNATACQIAMGEMTKADCVDLHLQDNEIMTIDGLSFKAIYTPGHTDDSFSFHLNDRVFTGDTLLIRGTGRTDFQNGSASAQYDSIFNKLLTLPDNTFIYPAHDYKGMTVSTIAEEKHFNPRLQVTDEAAYVDLMSNLNLARPKLMDIAVPANQICGLDK